MKNKMRKLIGRFTAALIIIALVLSVFSCAKAPTEDGAVADSLKTENNIPPENTPDINAEPNTEAAQNDNNEKTELPEKPKDKAAPCDVTIDEPFSDFEVVVSFTLEESAKDLEYFPEDFSEVDCFNVYPFDYYPEEIHPEYKGRKTVILMLGSQSKQGVLDAVKILEKDERVYSAEPNFIVEMSSEYIDYSTARLELTDEELSKKSDYVYTVSDFSYDGVVKVGKGEKGLIRVQYEFNNYDVLKHLANDKRVKRVYIHSSVINLSKYNRLIVFFTDAEQERNLTYTTDDFPNIDIANMDEHYPGSMSIVIDLKESGYRALFTNLHKFCEDERIRTTTIGGQSLTVVP